MAKKRREINFKPNFLFYWMWYKLGISKNRLNPSGEKVVPKFVNLGGSRSSKTFDAIHLIYKILTDLPNQNIVCNVYRATQVDCRKNTLKDFKKCFINVMKLEEDVDFTLVGEISGTPYIKVKGNSIFFLGYPEEGKQAGDCHIAYINEILEDENEAVVDNILRRPTMFSIMDANPNLTSHFIFNRTERFNWFYTWTNYLDNDKLPDGLRGEFESKCPWDFRDSKIIVYDYIPSMPAGWVKDEKGEKLFFNGFRKRVWTKEEKPDNYTDLEYPNNKYRAINKENEKTNSINRFDYLVYTEGIPCSREGAIFRYVKWLDKFPETGHDMTWYSMDFGFTSDPTVLARTGYRKPKTLCCDIMVCEPTVTPRITWDLVDKQLQKEAERRKKEGETHYDTFWIACESADNYMGQNWVEALNEISYLEGKNYNFFKISKGSISARVDLALMFNLEFVRHKRLETEVQNYVYLTINDKPTNQPDPNSKFCDCLDAIGYGIWQNGHGLE